ncbi:MAG: hypothetical protein H8D23_05110, partial [Candidatus Brocadiales bacterium]|nr:hypothetical protein [Candidatus Brocadiales bacterium]
MKRGRNVIFLILASMVLFCQICFAGSQGMETKAEDTVAVVLDMPPDGYSKVEIDAKLAQIMNAIPEVPNRYSNDEIDDKIAAVKSAIPNVSDSYTNEEIESLVAEVKESIPVTPDVYSKEEIKVRIRALNDAITNLEIALANIRNSIPAEIKWPVKT